MSRASSSEKSASWAWSLIRRPAYIHFRLSTSSAALREADVFGCVSGAGLVLTDNERYVEGNELLCGCIGSSFSSGAGLVHLAVLLGQLESVELASGLINCISAAIE